MATLTIRNLSDDVVSALKRRSAAESRSMEEEARRILTDAVNPGRDAYWERMRRRRASYGGKTLTDTVELVRAGRAERMRRLIGDK
jgi:antitoxin FitA